MTMTHEEIKAIYHDRVLSAIDSMQTAVFQHEREAYATQLAALADEVMAAGWSWHLVDGPDKTRGLAFVPINSPKKTVPVCKAPEQMTDRELLRHFANAVANYDDARDEEVEFRDRYPARDAWSVEQDNEYRGILAEIHAQYVQLRHLIEHINKDRR